MGLLAMTLITNSGRVDKGKNRSDFMPNRSMAICTFDLVIGHMIFMHELRGILGSQYLGFFMTLKTFSFRDMTISHDDIDMTLLTGYSSCNILSVIEAPAFNLDISFWLDMAGSTTSHRTRDALLLPSRTSPIKVANKTVGLMDGEMGSLNKLSMTGGTSKPRSPS